MPKAVESCPKCKKSPNLVTLIARWTNSYWLLWRHHENSPTFKRRSRHLSMEILEKMQEFDKTLKMLQKINFYTSGTLFPLFKRQIDTICCDGQLAGLLLWRSEFEAFLLKFFCQMLFENERKWTKKRPGVARLKKLLHWNPHIVSICLLNNGKRVPDV